MSVETQQMDPDLALVTRLLMHSSHWLLLRRAYMCLVPSPGAVGSRASCPSLTSTAIDKDPALKGNPDGNTRQCIDGHGCW